MDFTWSADKHWEFLEIPKVRGVTTLVVYDVGEYLELELIRVKKEKQGRGVGTRMVQRIQSIGKPIHCMADPEKGQEERLHRFYLSLGFQPHGKNTYVWFPDTT